MKQGQKQGQIQVTFHWIYVLIAGAVILLFFFSLILSQKQRSEQVLQQDITKIIESIFTAASLSEKTKTTVDTNLDQYVLFFNCRDGQGEYGLEGSGSSVQDSVYPLFSPAEIRSPQLSLWSLPYKLPFKVGDFLLVTAPNIKYVLMGTTPFSQEFLEETKPDPAVRFRINTLAVNPADLATVDPGKNQQVRFIDFTGGTIQEGVAVPEKVRSLDDPTVTAVVFSAENIITYFQKKGEIWKQRGQSLHLLSLGGERDAAKYAALFAPDAETYQCNFRKVLQRLSFLNEIYGGKEIANDIPGGKLKEIIDFYDAHPDLTLSNTCKPYVLAMQGALQSHQNEVSACLASEAACLDLVSSAQQLRQANQNLIVNDCISLY